MQKILSIFILICMLSTLLIGCDLNTHEDANKDGSHLDDSTADNKDNESTEQTPSIEDKPKIPTMVAKTQATVNPQSPAMILLPKIPTMVAKTQATVNPQSPADLQMRILPIPRSPSTSTTL